VHIALTHAYSWPEVRRGAERWIPELAGALDRRGHDITVFTAGSVREVQTSGRVTTVRLLRRHEDPARHEEDFGRRLLLHLARGTFDAVHSLGVRDAWASVRTASVRRKRRTVYTNLGLPWREWWSRQPDGRAHDVVARQVDVYGCMSQYALNMLEPEYGRSGVLTPGGVNLGEFVPADRRAETPTLMFAGAIAEPRKGLATLLAALPIVAASEPHVQLWLSGAGDVTAFLDQAPPEARRRTETLGAGEPSDQARRCAQAWATVLPSKFDSFGMALVESLACGTPIVASTHAAPSELVEPGTGAVCDPDDARSVAEACLAALDLARQPHTANLCRKSAEPYDWDTGLAPKFESFYEGTDPGV